MFRPPSRRAAVDSPASGDAASVWSPVLSKGLEVTGGRAEVGTKGGAEEDDQVVVYTQKCRDQAGLRRSEAKTRVGVGEGEDASCCDGGRDGKRWSVVGSVTASQTNSELNAAPWLRLLMLVLMLVAGRWLPVLLPLLFGAFAALLLLNWLSGHDAADFPSSHPSNPATLHSSTRRPVSALPSN
jgi:hypothetical protein